MTTTSLRLLGTALALLAVHPLTAAKPAAAAHAPRPNILLVVTDDQGYWDVHAAGNDKIDTPTLDRLAAEGVWLDRFYACPVCAPTRAGLLTGRYYLRTGVYNTRFGGDTMSLDETTLAEVVKQAGYRTGLFGKWHLGHYAGYRPHERGFDETLTFYEGHLDRYDYPEPLWHNDEPVEARGYVTDLFTDAAIDFVRTAGKRPFFCYLAYNAPHSPHSLGDSHDEQPRGDAMIEKYLKRDLPLREARIYAMVERIDQNLARLLNVLDELQLSDNTLVIFMSDNGGVSKAFKAGIRGNKAQVYEGGVRVPCFVRWPGRFPAGTKVGAMASHLDVLPTICDLLELPLPDKQPIDGRSILDLLNNGAGDSPHEYLCHTWNRYYPDPDNNWAISDGRYKALGRNVKSSKAEKASAELYDLESDPGETTDLATSHPRIVKRLRNEYVRWFNDVTGGQRYRPVPIPVGNPSDNPVEIQASWAQHEGDGVSYVFRGYHWDTLEGWKRPGTAATWLLQVERPGLYEVRLSYGRSPQSEGGTLRLSAGEAAVELRPKATVTAEVFRTVTAGTLRLPAGRTELKAEAVETGSGELMRLNRIWLRHIE
ncbi:MAG: arylsulfatase [Planctomycetota bacterium]